jgi:hypothetical protein
VGLGERSFEELKDLDADLNPIYSEETKSYQSRDQVQFVKFESYKSQPIELAQEVLKEIPAQLTQYFKSKGISPLPKKVSSDGVNTFSEKYF